MSIISLTQDSYKKDNLSSITISKFLENIKEGEWQDDILKLRTMPNATKEEIDIKKKLKIGLSAVTISGCFSYGNDKGLTSHSGLICMDIDNVEEPEELKEKLSDDPYIYSIFVSCGGQGLAVIFKIKASPKDHGHYFDSISNYLLDKYSLCSDSSCRNLSRLRFVSYDPSLYVNEKAKQFDKLLLKIKPAKKEYKIIHAVDNFTRILNEIQERRIDLVDDYRDWVKMAYALISDFGESGRSHFHSISSISGKYEAEKVDRQYSSCLRSNQIGSFNPATISSFYWMAKNVGIEIYDTTTIEIIQAAKSNLISGLNKQAAAENIKKFLSVDPGIIDEIVRQVDKYTFIPNMSEVEQIESDIRTLHDFLYNEITNRVEVKDIGTLDERLLRSIYLQTKKTHQRISKQLVEDIILSDSTPKYNPLRDWIEDNSHLHPNGNIKKLADCITGEMGAIGHDRQLFIRRWLIGVIASIYGKHSPTMLVLSGRNQGTGKTEFFRRLLPSKLKKYYAESKLDAGKDDEILMCEKLIIMDDEMSGKSKKDQTKIKQYTSTQVFTLRSPYGRYNEDRQRLAVLCGTTNQVDLLSDPTGNRRIIPLHVKAIDHELYNSIDKTELLIEAYHLYADGEHWIMNKGEIELLKKLSGMFEKQSIEEDLLWKYFSISGKSAEGEWYNVGEISTYLQNWTKVKLNTLVISSELDRFQQRKDYARLNGSRSRGWRLVRSTNEILETSHLHR